MVPVIRALIAGLVAFGAGAPVHAAGRLSEEQATRKAIEFLRGSAYGSAYFEILRHIEQTQLLTQGSNACGAIITPVWAFHVQTPYDGWLYLDAATGDKACSSIPFLR